MGKVRWLWLTAAVIGLDQVVKSLVVQSMALFERVEVLPPVLEWTRLHNRGAAFSFLDDASGWQKPLFIGLAFAVSAGIATALVRMQAGVRTIVPAGLALVAGGALGNAIDRLRFGYVVDFIHVHWYDSWWFPAFNVADVGITVGAALLILDVILDSRFPRK